MVSLQHISQALRGLGVSPGAVMLVHSSLSSMGHVEGGAEAAARALVLAVSPGGSVFVPTFNYGEGPYDPKATPSLTGAITEAFRKIPEAHRSLHPTHSIAGIGPEAQQILEGHEKTTPFGQGSPTWRLWQRNAWVLLIGCDHDASSMIHVAEEQAHMPYLTRTRVARVMQGGTVVEETVQWPGCSTSFVKIDAPLRAAGKIIDGAIGAAAVKLMRAQDIVLTALEMLKQNPTALLCDSRCARCAEAREIMVSA